MTGFAFDVIGQPVPQGSKRVFGQRLVDANASTLKPWRATVAAAAADAIPPEWDTAGAFHLTLEFDFARPKSHYGARGVLPSRAGTHHTQKPDLDKLTRAIFDSLTDAGVWRDDSQVADVTAAKWWTTTGSGVRVTVVREQP